MKITQALLGEHAVFYAQFDHLEHSVPTTEPAARVHALGALLAAGLATHARLEEELLFRTLEPHVGPTGPLAVMRMEHEEIERALDQLPGVQDLARAQHLLLQTVQVARQHFAKEEQVLFPMAEQTLGSDSLAQLGTAWAERRGIGSLAA